MFEFGQAYDSYDLVATFSSRKFKTIVQLVLWLIFIFDAYNLLEVSRRENHVFVTNKKKKYYNFVRLL